MNRTEYDIARYREDPDAYEAAYNANQLIEVVEGMIHALRYTADDLERKLRNYDLEDQYSGKSNWSRTVVDFATDEVLHDILHIQQNVRIDLLIRYASDLDKALTPRKEAGRLIAEAEAEAALEAANAHRAANPFVYTRPSGNHNWRFYGEATQEQVATLVANAQAEHDNNWIGAVECVDRLDNDKPSRELPRYATVRVAYRPS